MRRLRERALASTRPAAGAIATPPPTSAPAPVIPAVRPTMPVETRPTMPNRAPQPIFPRPQAAKPTPASSTPTLTSTPPSIGGALGTQPATGTNGHATSLPTSQATTTSAPSGPVLYSFNYFDTPWPDILDDFSRMSGLTIIGDVKGVTGNLTFRTSKRYTFEEAMDQLNELLLNRTSKMLLQLRGTKTDGYLVIGRLPDLMREIPPELMFNTVEDFERADLPRFTMCLVVYTPPPGWAPIDIIDQFRTRLDDYYGTQVYGDKLVLTGMARDHQKFFDIVDRFVELNPTPPTVDMQWKTIRLTKAKASDVQATLQRLYPPAAPTAPRPGEDPEARKAKEINFVADLTHNSIILKANDQKLKEIVKVIGELDSVAPTPDMITKVVKIENASPDEVANQLRTISQSEKAKVSPTAAEYMAPDEAESRKWDVFAQPGGQSIIIIGGPKGIDRAMELVKALDVAEVPQAKRTERYVLKYDDAAQIQQMMIAMLNPPGVAITKNRGLVFTPDQIGNAMIISGRDSAVAEALKLIEQLDQPGNANDHDHLVKLQKASASEIAGVLTQIAAPGAMPKGAAKQLAKFIPFDAGGYLMVRCSDEEWPRFEQIVKDLDGQTVDVTPTLRTFKLQHADANEVAGILLPMFQTNVPMKKGQAPPMLKITPDARDNTLRVWATAELIDRIAAMIPELDIASEQGRVQVIKLTNADAAQVATVLSATFGPGARPNAPGGPNVAAAIKITAEPITNSLLVIAPKSEFEQIQKIALSMDVDAEKKRNLRLPVPVRNLPATEVAETLKQLMTPAAGPGAKPGEQPVKIVASGDMVILDGPQDSVMKAFELMGAIDVIRAGREVRQYRVTDAEEAANALKMLMSGSSASGKGGAVGAVTAALAGTTQVYADTFRNLLIIHARPLDFPEIERLVKAIEMDPPESQPGEPTGGPGEWGVIHLKNCDARDIIYDLEDIFAPKGVKNPPEFKTGPSDKILLYKSKPRIVPEIEKMVKMFDVPMAGSDDPKWATKLVKDGMSASDVARQLAVSLESETGKRVEVQTIPIGIDIIDIHADEKPAAQSSQPSDSRGMPCVLPASLVRLVGSLAIGQATSEPAEKDKAADEEPVRIMQTSDGKLIFTGPSARVKRLQELYDDLAKEADKQNSVLKIFPIKYAPDVDQVAQRLEMVFNGRPSVPVAVQPQNPQQGQPNQPNAAGGPNAPGGAPGGGGRERRQTSRATPAAAPAANSRIQVVADTRTRQLFVRAVSADFPLIIAVLKVLDVESRTARSFKIFELKNLNAEATAQTLRDTLDLNTRGGPMGMNAGGGRRFAMQQGMQPGPDGQPQGNPGQPQPGQIPGQNPQQGMVASAETTTITAEPQTNSILVSAPPDTIKFIGDMIEKLEAQQNIQQATMKRVPLQFARASEIVTVLKDIVQRTSTMSGGGGGPGGRMGQMGGGGGGGRGSGAQVSINADPRTNSIVLAGAKSEVENAEEIIKSLDVNTGDTGQIKIVPVKGDAAAMATSLKEMYAKPGAAGAQSDVAITADAATGNLLVRAPPQTQAEILATIREMEKKVASAEPRMIKLALADVDSVAKKLEAIFAEKGKQGGGKLKITPIASTKSIAVQASDELYREIEKAAKDMDVQNMDITIKHFRLKNAKAVEVVDKMKDLLAQVVARMQGGQAGDLNLGLFSFTPDPLTNSIVVVGNPMTFVVVQKLLDSLDVEPSTLTQREVRSYVLNPNVNAAQVAGNIGQLFAGMPQDKSGIPAPSVTSEPNSNMVLVTATAAQHKDIQEKIIAPILAQVSQAPKQFTVPLKFARADEVATTLNNYFSQWKTNQGNKPQDTITIVPDLNANVLLVTANETMKKLFDEQLKGLDVAAQEAGLRVTRTYQVKIADPNSVVNMINNNFAPQGGRQPSPRELVKAAADWATGSIVVTASPEKQAEIAKLIDELDKATDTARTTHVIDVSKNDARDVATTLTTIYNQKQKTRTGAAPVTISAMQGSNKIIVNCNETELAEIVGLVKQIEEGGGSRLVHVVTMPEQVKAKAVADSISKLFANQAGPGGQGVKAEANDATNTVLVFATEDEFKKINAVIEKLAEVPPMGAVNNYFVRLKYAVADKVARTLDDFFRSKQGLTNQTGGRFFDGGAPPTEKALEDRVTVKAEAGSNMLIIACTEGTKKVIDKIIEEIDTDPSKSGGNALEMIKLKYIEAADMMSILENYLRVANSTTTEDPQASLPWWMRGQTEKQEEKTVLVGDTRLKAIESMNTIIVVGKPETITKIKEQVALLDRPDNSGTSNTKIIPLANANPAQLAPTLTKIFAENGQASVGKGQSYRAPVILADSTTRSLIVRAGPTEMPAIERMVADLDQKFGIDPPTVRTIKLPNGVDTEEIARIVSKQLNDAEKQNQAKLKDYQPDTVSIEPDARSNLLVVAASKSQFEQVTRLVDLLVQGKSGGGMGVSVIKLKSMRPEDAKKLIEDMKNRRSGARSDARERREYRLNGREDEVPARPSGVRFSPRYAMVASAILSAAMAQTTTGQATQPEGQRPAVSTIRPAAPVVAQGAAPHVATPLTSSPSGIMSAQLSGAPLTIQTGPDGLIVIGNEEDRAVIAQMMALLDEQVPHATIEYVPLKNAQAVALAKSLAEVYQKIDQARPQGVQARPEEKVALIADPRTNGLYIAATESKIPEVKALIEKSDLTPTIPQSGTRTFVLKHRRVRDVEPTLKAVIQQLLKKQGITDQNTIGITKDDQVNSLFVTGGEKDLDEVGKVIDTLDKPPPKAEDEEESINVGSADIMVIPLRVATADKLAAALNKLITDASKGETPTKDFIRRLRVLDESGKPIADLRLDGPTFVVADVESNSVIAASTRKNLLVLKAIIKQFDVEPLREPAELKVRPLNFADATEIADELKKMLDEAKKLPSRAGKSDAPGGVPEGGAGVLVYNTVVTPDPRTNSIVMIGKPEAVAVLDDLVAKIDVRGVGLMPFAIIKLEYASATAMESVLDDLMKKRADALPKGTSANSSKSETVIIKGDPRAETLIVAARADRMAEIRDLVSKLDVKALALIDNIRTIQLTNGNAADLAKKIDDLWTKRAEQKQSGNVKLEKPAIVADERSNSLVVASAKGDFEAIESLVRKLESLPFGPIAEIRIVQLRYNSAKELAPVFKKLFDERAKQREGTDGKTRPTDMVAIENDPITNSILVACSKENFELLTQMLKTLDVEAGVAGVADMFALRNVEAQRVKKTLDDVFKDGLYKPGGGAADSTNAKTREKVTVATEDRSNTLIVSASPENMSIIRKIVQQMDDVSTPWNLTNTRLFQLQYADAVKLAAQLQDYFKKLDESAAKITKESTEVPITIIADDRTNRLLVGGTRDGLAKAQSLIKDLDVPPEPSSTIQVYRLHDGSAAKIGPTLEAIFKDRNQPRGAGTGTTVQNVPVTIKIDETSNALVISASREDQALIKNLVELLDRRSNILEQVRLFALSKARADAIKKIIEELYKGGGTSSGGTGGTSGGSNALPVAVTTDPRTNAIVVAAPPGEMENIAKLVERLDSAMPIDEAQIGIFVLENADAKKTSELLKDIMAGNIPTSGGSGGGSSGSSSSGQRELGSMLLSFIKTDAKGREAFYKTIRENVQVTYDERTNAVIVVAPPTSVALVKNLVKTLDDSKKREVLVRVFMLRNADATKTVELLEKIFAQDKASADQAAFQEGREIKVEGGTATVGGPTAASQGGVQGKGTFGKPKTTFTPDQRTNSVVVAGWQEDIDVAGDIIDQLDSQDIRDRINMVYSLQNAKAEDVVTSLDSYFQKQTSILDKQEGLSPARKAEQEVSAVAYKQSNQLILSYSPRYQAQVLDIVRQLDMPPPQVMIQVLLAEVNIDNRFELGMEYALQNLRFSETAVAGPNGTLQSDHFDVIGGTDLGAAASSGGLGGFSFTITGEDFNFLVRTLQSDSKLEVLQRPMIMCQDNQDASINVGQSVPFLTGTQVTNAGQVNSQIQYQDIGVKLAVTPHINPDGFVYMKVKPEISQITPSTINIGNGITAQIFSKRDAETSVVVKDGETVVIGGLITTSEQEAENKVPILGDMPAIGALFRATTRSKTKTELLIVLTPRVIRTVEDARRMSIENRDVTSVLTQEQKQSVLMNGLRLTPESDVEAIEDSQQEPVPAPPPQPPSPDDPMMQPVSSARPAGGAVPPTMMGDATYGPFAPEYGPFGANKPSARPASTVIPASTNAPATTITPARNTSTWNSPASPEFAAPPAQGTETLEAQPLEPYDPKSP